MPVESIKNPLGSDNNFAPSLIDNRPLPYAKFAGNCFILNSISLHQNVVNLYIFYTLDIWSRNLNIDLTLVNCLFGVVKLTRNADPDKYEYSGYGIGFDVRLQFSLRDRSWGKNVIIFGDSSSVHVRNKTNDILVLAQGPTQRLDETTITAEAKYPINFTESGKIFKLSLHYNGSHSYLFFNAVKNYQSKAKDSEIKPFSLYPGNISKYFTLSDMKKIKKKYKRS